MKKLIILLAFLPLFSLAQESQEQTTVAKAPEPSKAQNQRSLSEALYFPSADSSRFQISAQVRSNNTDYKSNATDRNTLRDYNEQTFQLSWDRGLWSDWALHLDTFFGNAQSEVHGDQAKQKFNYNGSGDLRASLSKINPLKNGNSILGATVAYSPDHAKVATKNKSGNMYSGGHSFMPFAAFESQTSFGAAGGVASYKIYGDSVEDAPDGETMTTSGQNVMSLEGFLELQKSSYLLGLSAGLDMVERGSWKSNIEGRGDMDARTLAAGTLYGRVALTESSFIRPAVTYRTLLTPDVDNVTYDRYENVSASVGLGLLF